MFDFLNETVDLSRIKTDMRFPILIYPWAIASLNELYERAMAPGGSGTAPETPLFTIKSVVRTLSTACKEIGLPPFTPRSVRRVFVYYTKWGAKLTDKQVGLLQGQHDDGTLVRTRYDNAKSSDDPQRRRDEIMAMREQVATAASKFGCTEVPELVGAAARRAQALANTMTQEQIEAELDAKMDQAVEAAIARVNKSLRNQFEKCNAARWADQIKADDPKMIQSELISLAQAASTPAMHEAKRAKRKQLLQALIDAGNLEKVASERRSTFNSSAAKVRVIKKFIRNVADPAQLAELNQQLAAAKAEFNSAFNALRAACDAIALQKTQRTIDGKPANRRDKQRLKSALNRSS